MMDLLHQKHVGRWNQRGKMEIRKMPLRKKKRNDEVILIPRASERELNR
jgi:hypothetical protein